MNYNYPDRNNSTIAIRLMCAIVFLLFAFAWLYFFQSDMMAALQHVLSGGLTRYHRLTYTVIIVAVLVVVQQVCYAVFRLRKRSHALSYLPSMLLLAVISDINADFDLHFSIGAWIWVFPLILVVWIGMAVIARFLQQVEPEREPCGLFSKAMCFNLLFMVLMVLGVALVGNTNAVFHYRMSAEARMVEGNYAAALKTGEKSLESDEHLLMIRMYALSREHLLGERLFTYPITGSSETILPTNGKARLVYYPADSLYRFLGARPVGQMQPMRYLQLLAKRDSTVSRQVADYELCGLLIDKRLDDFVARLKRYYALGDSLSADDLPRHYREALTLYTHLRAHPIMVYHDTVMEEDYANLRTLEKQYADPRERQGNVEEHYRGTYWYYYEYVEQTEV